MKEISFAVILENDAWYLIYHSLGRILGNKNKIRITEQKAQDLIILFDLQAREGNEWY